MLEHHADLAAADLAQTIVVERDDVLAVDQHLTRRRVVQPVDHAHERRLARARQSHHDEDLALGDVEGDVAHRGHAPGLREQFTTRQVGVGRAYDFVGLGSVDLPHVATRRPWRSASRPRCAPPPGSGPRRTHRTDRPILVLPAGARKSGVAEPTTAGASRDVRRGRARAGPSPTSAIPTYWFATGRSCRNAIESATAIRGNTAEAISTIDSSPCDAPIE